VAAKSTSSLSCCSGARALARALEGVLERADVGATVVVAALRAWVFRTAARAGVCGVVRANAAASGRRVGRADDVAVAARPLRQWLVLAVGNPYEPGVEVVERRAVVAAEHRAPDRR
jgi:hypothetical protein